MKTITFLWFCSTTVIVLSVLATVMTLADKVFSEDATRGKYCDHDKISDSYYTNRFFVSHSYDSGNLEKPFNLQTHFVDNECSFNGDDTSTNCGRCNSNAGGKMKTFAVSKETATCRQEDLLTDKKKDYITEVLDQARQILKELVVAPDFSGGGLTPNPGTSTRCGRDNTDAGVVMPVTHQVPQIGVHFMLYVTTGPPSRTLQSKRGYTDATIDNNEIKDEPLAWAGTCGYTQGDERPIVGHIHFAPRAIDEDPGLTTSNSKKLKDVYFVIHQIMHMLGWSDPMFRKGHTTTYLSTTKTTYTPAFISSKTFTSSESRRAIDTTTVRQEARTHFGCSTLSGAEYFSAQQDSHLAKRVFADDLMSEPLPWDPVPYLSRISFASLRDTGFFKVDLDLLSTKYNQSKFGKEKGCNFVRDKDCRSGTNGDYDEYCWNERDEQCNVDLSYGGPCNIVNHQSCVPSSRLFYFEQDCRLGGPELNDYCPTPARVNSYGQCDDISNNKDPKGAYRLGSSYSNTSRCVQGTMARVGESPRTPFLETRCVELVCGTDRTQTPNNRSLFMKLFNDSVIVKCPELGATIDVGFYSTNYSGYLVCPVFSESFCSDNGLVEIGDVNSLSSPVVDQVVFSSSPSCENRTACAQDAYDNFDSSSSGSDSCTSLSRSIQNCFLSYCVGEKNAFLTAKLKSNCSKANFVNLAENVCADGIEGAADLCSVVSTAGAGKLMSMIIVGVMFLLTIILM